jgi:hypothetical protein
MRTIMRPLLVALSLVLGLGPTACATRTGAPPESPGVSQPAGPIRVGASIALTGRYDRTGKELQNGYLLWVEQVNAAGGVMGGRSSSRSTTTSQTLRPPATSTRS